MKYIPYFSLLSTALAAHVCLGNSEESGNLETSHDRPVLYTELSGGFGYTPFKTEYTKISNQVQVDNVSLDNGTRFSAFSLQGAFGACITDRTRLEIAIEWAKTPTKTFFSIQGPNGWIKAEADAWTLAATLNGYVDVLPITDTTTVFIGAGLGIHHTKWHASLKTNIAAVEALNKTNETGDYTTFTAQIMSGLLCDINEHLAMKMQVRFQWVPEKKYDAGEQLESALNLSKIAVDLGLQYYF